MNEQFHAQLNRDWQLKIDDPGTEDWTTHWMVDGLRADVRNTPDGMVFSGGPIAGDNSCHAVLWTHDSFQGDLKVEFDFTRLDCINRFVNIIYFQANGIEEEPYSKNIHDWKHLRKVPYMATYFNYMDLLHVSYAAFGNDNDEPDDYIRVRRYPVRPDRTFHQIEVEPTNFNTEIFEPGRTCHMCFIKTDADLFLHVTGDDLDRLYHWDVSTVDPVNDGPVGIRHMHQKSSLYKNIQISQI